MFGVLPLVLLSLVQCGFASPVLGVQFVVREEQYQKRETPNLLPIVLPLVGLLLFIPAFALTWYCTRRRRRRTIESPASPRRDPYAPCYVLPVAYVEQHPFFDAPVRAKGVTTPAQAQAQAPQLPPEAHLERIRTVKTTTTSKTTTMLKTIREVTYYTQPTISRKPSCSDLPKYSS